jgi:hypothetical protein
MCCGPCPVALDLDDRRPEQVLMGIEPTKHALPLGYQGRTGDLVGLGAEERSVVAVYRRG